MHQAATPNQHYDGLQVLRAIAALIVILYHTGHMVNKEIGSSLLTDSLGWDRWGIAAVLLFFSISGFVISQAAERAASPFIFLADRLLRIYPGYLLAAGLTISLYLCVYGSFPWAAYKPSSLTLLPLGIKDYVLGGVEWSLTYEMAFYIITFLWLLAFKPKRLWVLSILWIGLIISANLFSTGEWKKHAFNPDFMEALLSVFCIPFWAGMICYRIRHFLIFIQWPGLLAAGSCYGVYAISNSTSISVFSLTLGGILLIMTMVNCFGKKEGAGPPSPSLLWLGNRSYGLYLFHVPLISTTTIAYLKQINPPPALATISLALITISGAAAFASLEYAIYKFLRIQFRHKSSIAKSLKHSSPA